VDSDEDIAVYIVPRNAMKLSRAVCKFTLEMVPKGNNELRNID